MAGQSSSDEARHAFETLFRRYWYPLYSYARRMGCNSPEADDLTQSFFGHLLATSALAKADPAKGRFRTFLLQGLKNYLISEFRRNQALKRGAGVPTLPLDEVAAEGHFSLEPKDENSPDKLFDRNWALNLLDQTFQVLQKEFERAGRAPVFEVLHRAVLKEEEALTYAELGSRLGMSESAVKVAVHRLRRRYREVLRGLVASTVSDPKEIDAELNYLLQVLS